MGQAGGWQAQVAAAGVGGAMCRLGEAALQYSGIKLVEGVFTC